MTDFRLLAGLTGLVVLAQPAAAQRTGGSNAPLVPSALGTTPYYTGGGVLPNVGTDPRIEDLRPQLQQYLDVGVSTVELPKWVVEPSLGVDAGVTDNALEQASPRRGDFFTTITPQIYIRGDTARLKATLSYSPVAQIYASQSSQTRFDQFGQAQALGIIVPDALFLDVRGFISESSRTGNGINNFSTTTYNSQNEVQTVSFSVTPYAEHRFGGWGTGRVGYSYARTIQDSPNSSGIFTSNNNSVFGTQPYGALGNLTTQRERAAFVTGENLGRFNVISSAEAYQYNGSGSYSGAHRNQQDNELGYALTRRITLLGGIGYQDIRYGGVPVVQVNEPTYNFGARYSPSDESSVTVLYGRRDGISSVTFDGSVAPTARTRLTGRYTTGITSDLEQAQTILDATTVGPNGLLVDNVTGSPVNATSISGVQNGIYKLRRFSANGVLLQLRDSYSVGVTTEDRTTLTTTTSIVGGAVIPAGTSTSSIYGTASWQHDLSPSLSSTATVQYGVTDSTSRLLFGNSQQQRLLSISASLNKQLTETLSGSVQYIRNDQSGGQTAVINGINTGNFTENILLVGLRKRF